MEKQNTQLATSLTVFGQPIVLSNMDDPKKATQDAIKSIPQKMGFDTTKGGDQKPIVVYSKSNSKGSKDVLTNITSSFGLNQFKDIIGEGLETVGVEEIDLEKIIVDTETKAVDLRVGINFNFTDSKFLKFLEQPPFKDIITLNAISFETTLVPSDNDSSGS